MNIHIISHTHWDREWFLTSVYTSRWIPGLIDKLEQLVEANPDYKFWFDGQTLVVEDLLDIAPDYADRVQRLIKDGNLSVGPYYCQPDWKMTSGELLIRNLIYGQKDLKRLGGQNDTGWLVDTFGHISQSPQIHLLCNINATYVWRGVPAMEPYFYWQGADGSRLLTIDLFGGYRNLYGVSHVPEIAIQRLEAEVAKLQPFYPTPDIPLFDGYDLEFTPEDPLQVYAGREDLDPDLALQASSPPEFARAIAEKRLNLPTIAGELNSGKYGATFPGVFSARTYLKIMAHDCERMLFRICEPLATMAWLHGRPYSGEKYEKWGRSLLQNAVHDCICGVSIDLVHEKMEYGYRQVYDGIVADVQDSLDVLMSPFASGDYAISTTPFATDLWQMAGDDYVHVQTAGVGVWPVLERIPVKNIEEIVDTFHWKNDHYEATVGTDGIVAVGDANLGTFVVAEEHGDTYSDETGKVLGWFEPVTHLTIEQRSMHHTVIGYKAAVHTDQGHATAKVNLHFDQSPLIRWQIDLDSQGTNMSLNMRFHTAIEGGVTAGMPFDAVERPLTDTDLLPRELPGNLSSVLLGQRELDVVTTFPMRDYVSMSDGQQMIAVLSKGIRAYSADVEGTIQLVLRRSVEWLTEPNLERRVGDAGPFFYVPDARCERVVHHEVAVAVGFDSVESEAFQGTLVAYQTPPLLVHHDGEGSRREWQLLQESAPMSGLQVVDDAVLARFYNPATESRAFTQGYAGTDVWGQDLGAVTRIEPKQIVTVKLTDVAPQDNKNARRVTLLTPLEWRVGENRSRPDPAILEQLQSKVEGLAEQVTELEAQIARASGPEQLHLQHRLYVAQREQLEFELSHLLCRKRLAETEPLRYEYLYHPDDEIARIGRELNQLRIKRRIFDYVVEAI